MADLFSTTFGQIPKFSQTLTVGPPDILGNMTISGLNGTVDTISTGVFGDQQLQAGGETAAPIQDSVFGNYQITTDEGTFTAINNTSDGENLLHFGEVVAVSRPGLLEEENWYDVGTNELLATTDVNGFGHTMITMPSNLDTSSLDVLDGLDNFSTGSDFCDAFASSSDFFDFLDFI